MGIPSRTYIRFFHKLFITENPLVIAFMQIKKILTNCSELPQKNRCLSNDLKKRKIQLEKAKQILDSSTVQEKNSINLFN